MAFQLQMSWDPDAARIGYPCKQALLFSGLEPALAAFTIQSNGSTSPEYPLTVAARV
jgi:hypothetical protein